MHQKAGAEAEEKAHRLHEDVPHGTDGGKPANGAPGVQPELFYKGNGFTLAAPGGDLVSPEFADDAGEEPEVAGIYDVIAEDGTPFRVGFALSKRVLGPRDGAAELSLSRAFEIAAGVVRSRDLASARCPPTFAACRASAAAARRSSRSLSVGRGEHVAFDRQSRASSLQISAVPAARRRATCTCSAQRRCPSPTA